jgi:hypothetical protein
MAHAERVAFLIDGADYFAAFAAAADLHPLVGFRHHLYARARAIP